MKGAQVLLFIRPLRQWHLWRPMSFHIQHQLRRGKWERRAQAARLGLPQAQGRTYHEAGGGIGLVFQGHRQTARVRSRVDVAAPKKKQRGKALLLSFPQSSPQSSNCQSDEATERIALWAIKAFWWSSWEFFFSSISNHGQRKRNKHLHFVVRGKKKASVFSQGLSLINLEATSNYFSWLKCVPSIWTVQLAGTRFFQMHIFAWPLLRERCEVVNNRIFKRRNFRSWPQTKTRIYFSDIPRGGLNVFIWWGNY